MNTSTPSIIRKASMLAGALLVCWAVNAQTGTTNGNSPTSDSTHRQGMHRPGFNRDGFNRDGFNRDGQRGDWSGKRPDGQGWGSRDRQGFAHNRFGRGHGFRHGDGIRYTPEQRKQLMAINKDFHQQSAALYKKDNITLREYKASLLALQKDRRSKMEALLTPAQKDQLAKRKKMQAENAQVMAAARMERMKLRLNLTDDQVAKLKSGQESFHAQAKAIRENQDLLPEQKMEQLKALSAKRQDNFKSVLTPEQQSQFQQMRRSHHPHGGPWGRDGQSGGAAAEESKS